MRQIPRGWWTWIWNAIGAQKGKNQAAHCCLFTGFCDDYYDHVCSSTEKIRLTLPSRNELNMKDNALYLEHLAFEEWLIILPVAEAQ